MNIETLKARVFYLSGQLDEAKKILVAAQGELDNANKTKQANEEASPEPSPKP